MKNSQEVEQMDACSASTVIWKCGKNKKPSLGPHVVTARLRHHLVTRLNFACYRELGLLLHPSSHVLTNSATFISSYMYKALGIQW